MPVHDAMYTASKAEELKKLVSPEHNSDLYEWLTSIEEQATEASSLSAKAALRFFDALGYAMDCDDKEIASKAKEIYFGTYNAEIA